MTTAEDKANTAAKPMAAPAGAESVSLTIDGQRIVVPEGTLVIRAAELLGIQIPRFCDHPLLEPVGACRQCLVDVEGQRKPVASCTTPVAPDMAVRTQATSAAAESAQRAVMELLLINHPLDCPVCDKGGECPLQNQAVTAGRAESRFDKAKRTYPKPIPLSPEVLLDRERCVLCARCTRFSNQIAGDPFIELLERGALQQVGVADGATFDSYFSGNTVQICPVGALTATAYRFRARPFDLVSSPSVCEHCASGCAQRTDHRRGKVLRRLAGDDPEVNEEWNCDKGRWAFTYASVGDRIATPLIRERGALREASWSEALEAAAAGLRSAAGRAGVLVGGRSTVEDACAYSEFARTVLRTNDIDFRARPQSAEEEWFLGARIAGNPMSVTYADLDTASTVVLVGLEPEEESPIVFLRLRRAVRTRGLPIVAIAPFRTRGLSKLDGRLVMTAPGGEAAALASLTLPAGAIILVGERLASSPGALVAADELADRCGARLGWVPRRAGERGALEAGCLPTLLPGGRPVGHPRAREQTVRAWRGAVLPDEPGRDTAGMLAAAAAGQLRALVVGGVELDDLVDPQAARSAIAATGFVVSLEVRASAVSDASDVVFPVAPVAEKPGTFLTWEGRPRTFGAALESNSLPDEAVLRALARSMGGDLGDVDRLRAIGGWDGRTATPPAVEPPAARTPHRGQAVLATWKSLLDGGRLLDGNDRLTAAARPAVARLSAATAAEVGAANGDPITVASDTGHVTLPLAVTDMPDRVVWVPTNSAGLPVHARLRIGTGAVVGISVGVR